MADIKDTVGERGANAVHDVAIVQAMLRVIRNAQNHPYLASNYDGVYGPDTRTAIKTFQTDQSLVPATPVPGTDKQGLLAPGGATVTKLNAMLPATHAEIRIIENTKTVYLPGLSGNAEASRKSFETDAQLEPTFRAKAAKLVEDMYATHKIVLWAGPLGRHRTFAEQQAIPPANTKAGPGESNHNFGRAADMVFKDLEWVRGDGTLFKDDPWLKELSSASSKKAATLWDARDAVVKNVGLFTLGLDWDRPHVQSYDQTTASMRRSLAALLNTVGRLKWDTAPQQYKSDLGLGGPMVGVGTAKQIWAGQATVSKMEIVTAINQSHVSLKKARGLWAGTVVNDPAAFTPINLGDVKAADVAAVQKALKADFEAAETNYLKWKPVP